MYVNYVYIEIFLKNFIENLKIVCGRLVKNLMRGFELFYDLENKFLFGII